MQRVADVDINKIRTRTKQKDSVISSTVSISIISTMQERRIRRASNYHNYPQEYHAKLGN